MIKVHNIRAGFATNSSSSHSVVIIPTDKVNTVSERSNDGMEYGWDNFVLTSVDEKMKYFATQLYSSLRRTLDEDVVIQIVKDITDVDLNYYSEENNIGEKYIDAYVDHQSVWCLNSIDIKSNDYKSFLHDLRDYLMKDEIIIVGGNDNSDGNPHVPSFGKEDHLIQDTIGVDYSLSNKIIRKDGDYYTFFSKATGTKIRISLKDNVKPYRKSSTPELVDLKITQYCPYGCEFCLIPGTEISTINGIVPIEQVSTGDLVLVYDFENKTETVETVMETYSREYDGDIIEIELENNKTITITPEHEVFTQRGWVQAGNLQITDDIKYIK